MFLGSFRCPFYPVWGARIGARGRNAECLRIVLDIHRGPAARKIDICEYVCIYGSVEIRSKLGLGSRYTPIGRTILEQRGTKSES
jgi:hypothetical protein